MKMNVLGASMWELAHIQECAHVWDAYLQMLHLLSEYGILYFDWLPLEIGLTFSTLPLCSYIPLSCPSVGFISVS